MLQCLLILTSDADGSYMVKIDPMMGTIYYLIFMVKDIMNIILNFKLNQVTIYLIVFKMFIAILDGHFTELINETGVIY